MIVPCYPDFIPIDLEVKESLHPRLSLTADGVSEFTFCGLYLFRNRYNYRISRDGSPSGKPEGGEGGFIISGEQPQNNTQGEDSASAKAKKFFSTPCGAPGWETLQSLFETHDYWKNISESVLSPVRELLEERGISVEEDRDNFDYLYDRQELAELSGKKFHKKKNHVNHFLHTYPDHEQKQMSTDLVPAAIEILDRWYEGHKDKNADDEYRSAREALEFFDTLALRGAVFFVAGKPAAYCLGESIARGKMFVIHFEKAIDEYKGLYQFMNQAFAASLPRFFTLINREQDLGSEGLRQAKMTYRPCGFVEKYRGRRG